MSAPPYMKLYVADYLADTTHLSRGEHGAYLLLLMAMWRAGGRLPADDTKLAAISKCTPKEWAEIRPAMLEFFQRRGGLLSHKRVSREIAKYEDTSDKRSEAGKRGAAKKARNNSDKATANAEQTRSNSSHNQNQNHNHSQKEDPPAPKGDGGLFGDEVAEAQKLDDVQVAFDLWNATAEACGLPRAKALDDNRRRAIRKRLEVGGLETWRAAMLAVSVSAFLRGLRTGSDGRAFKADLTFVCQAKSYQKLIDGAYGEDAPAPIPDGQPPEPVEDPWRRRVQDYAGPNQYWNRLDWGPPPGRPGCTVANELLVEFGYPTNLLPFTGRVEA